jgi:hypothetical protein
MDPLGQLNAIGLVRGKAQLPDPLPLAAPQRLERRWIGVQALWAG